MRKLRSPVISAARTQALVASSASLILEFDLYSDWHDWTKISGGGFIKNHDPEGDTLYGIEIMVHPEFRGMRLARRLYEAAW